MMTNLLLVHCTHDKILVQEERFHMAHKSTLEINDILDREKCEGFRGTFRDWVEALLVRKREGEWWAMFWFLCWNIWIGRNAKVFEGKRFDFMEVANRAVRGVVEFNREKECVDKREEGEEMEVRWGAPMEGVYKLNTDAAMIKDRGIGMGGVVRDSEGDVMLATSCGMRGIENVEIAEALSARHGLQVTVEAGLRNLIVEVDCKKLFNHLQSRICEISPFGKIVADILALSTHCSSLSFSHVKRQGNKVAHLLAQMCKATMDFRVWIEESPVEVDNAVSFDKPPV